MHTPAARYDQEQIDRAVKIVEKRFTNHIERIRYSIGQDWSEAPALFFRVLLKENVILQDFARLPYRRPELVEIPNAITSALRKEIEADALQPYFAFRTVTEQQKFRDSDWD